ncbi:MAG: polysaccharide deacetylase family protein [Patescibacteria group bacterium]|mgnify:CR=1 FL=1
MFFQTSWDDGCALDLRIAGLLERYGLSGTFYVCPREQHGASLLEERDIRSLAERHAIGAHTLTHPRLTRIPLADAEREIRGSKAWVERVTGKPCTSFCYPYGDVNAEVRGLVERAGFAGARTTEDFRFTSKDPFLQPVTLQVSPFPWRKRFHPPWKILDPLGPARHAWTRTRGFDLPLSAFTSWSALAMALLYRAQPDEKLFFHLYGHSREIERYGMWGALETFLAHVGRSGKEG